jgi:macrolide transport system ATP-binding/permease protein
LPLQLAGRQEKGVTMRELWSEVRYALRQLRRSPGFAATAIVTLALGIGANAAVFTVFHAVLLRNLPVADPKMLLRLGDTNACCYLSGKPPNDDYSLFAYDLYLQLKASAPEFEQLAGVEAGHDGVSVRSAAPGELARYTRMEFVSGNYFLTLGIKPYLGRLLQPGDDQPGAAPAVVLSYAKWQQDFGGKASVVGSVAVVNGHPFTVAGVTPPAFYGERLQAAPAGIYMPFALEPLVLGPNSNLRVRTSNWVYILGRVRPGVSVPVLESKLDGTLRAYLRTLPEFARADEQVHLQHAHLVLTPGGGGITRMRDSYAGGLKLLLLASALLLLIACANIANLLLVRGMGRAAETSLRVALGAERRRIIRQMLLESLVIALLGGLASLAVGAAGTRLLLLLAFSSESQVPISAAPSPAVLLFALAVSLGTALVCGAMPAWLNSRAEPIEALRGAHRATRGGRSGAQQALVVVQAALALVLLVGAGLLGKSLYALEHQDFGIATENRYVAHMDPQAAGYRPEQLPALYREIESRMEQVPGVRRAALLLYSPLEGNNWGSFVYREGRPAPSVEEEEAAAYVRVTPNAGPVLGIKLLRGRWIADTDTSTSPGVAVVNEAFVRRYFAPGEDPLGKRFGKDGMKSVADFTIVGVVRDSKYHDPDDAAPQPLYFRPFGQLAASDPAEDGSWYAYSLMLETSGPVPGLERGVRQTLASINPDLPLVYFSSLTGQMEGELTQQRLLARLTEVFGGLSILLAALGLYGVTSFRVARRTGEIGVRMALGAPRASVVRMVLGSTLAEAGLGLLVGLPAAVAAASLVRAQLWGVKAWDPAVVGAAAAVLTVAAALAGWLPAQRAASIDPVRAMRAE